MFVLVDKNGQRKAEPVSHARWKAHVQECEISVLETLMVQTPRPMLGAVGASFEGKLKGIRDGGVSLLGSHSFQIYLKSNTCSE